MKNVIIIGSGPAGISSALYLARSGNINVCIISNGKSALQKTDKIENYYGFAEPISGSELEKRGIEGAKRLGVKFINEEVVGLTFDDSGSNLQVITSKNTYTANGIVIATGSSRKVPNIKGIVEFEGKGVSYCAVCDAFFYRNKDVCVIGNGEYALHEAQVLAPICKSVTLLTNGDELLIDLPKDISYSTKKIISINGKEKVSSLTFDDNSEINTSGIFVALGVAGSTELARKIGAETFKNTIKVDDDMMTSVPGLFSAGDCTGGILQISKAVADGAKAGLALIKYLR